MNRVKRWGKFGIALAAATMLLFVPVYFFVALYETWQGEGSGFWVQISLGFLWLSVLSVITHGIYSIWRRRNESRAEDYQESHRHIHKHKKSVPSENERKRHSHTHKHVRRNMFDQVLEAMDRIAAGDYNVFVQTDERYLYSEIANKVNALATDLNSMEEMRQGFISNVSHEIQSPLTSIGGFAALLRDPALDDESRLHYLTIIEQECKRLSRLSDNLMKLSMLETQEIHLDAVQLDKQLQQALLLLEPQWMAKELELQVELETVTIDGDGDLLEQVWINLIHNSIKFTPEGGRIMVSLWQDENTAYCEVRDSGVGITKEDLVLIFDRFYKADKARARQEGGNGLGLSLVKRIVELHGGSVLAWSEEGGGTKLSVALPLRPASSDFSIKQKDPFKLSLTSG